MVSSTLVPAPTPTPEPQPTAAPTEAPAAEAPQEEAPAAGGETRTFAIDPAASQASYTVDEEFFSGAEEVGL